MSVTIENIRSACQRNVSSEVLLDFLLHDGTSAEVAQYIRTSEAPRENVGLLERCFQAFRKGTLSGPATEDDVESGEGMQRRLEQATTALFKAGMSVIVGDGDDAQLAAYPSVLLDNLDLLKFRQLAVVLSDICQGVEIGSSGIPRLLQLLPKAATQLLEAGAPEDEAEEDDNRAVGNAAERHVDTALHRITHGDWVSKRGNYAVQIMEALRDVPMKPLQLHSVITKALSVCSACSDLAALPALLRQLMRLAGLGKRALVLRGVLALFDRLEATHRGPDGKGPSQVLQNVEGTALVIIADAFKYDSALAEELLKSVRASAAAPSPFCLLLLFTLSRQHKLDTQVVTLLRTLVLAAFEWDATRLRSSWLSSLPQLPRPGGQQLRGALLRAVKYSGVGGEVVVPGILALGAALMAGCPPAEALVLVQRNDAALAEAEAEAAAVAAARRALKQQQQQQKPPLAPHHHHHHQQQQQQQQRGPLQGSAALQSALLGIQLLQAAFEAHREARPDVLRVCHQALGGAAGCVGPPGSVIAGVGALSSPGQELALPSVLLLSNLAARHPALLYEHTTKLKGAFQSFLLLPAPVALGLLLGLWPLASCCRDLADYLVMLLRKVMFAREASSRLVAVRGFLFILLQQLRAAGRGAAVEDEQRLAAAAAAAAAGPSFSQASCSQSSLSQMKALVSGVGVSLHHELQGFLRRALGQQAPVRAALYNGLSEILLVDPGSRDIVLELVAPQFYRYVANGTTMPPLHCKLLVGGGNGTDPVVLLEPLPTLLACVRRLVALCRDLGYVDDSGAAGGAAGGGGGGGSGPRNLGLLADEEDANDDAVMVDVEPFIYGATVPCMDLAVKTLVRTWDSFARRLLRCEAEHFELNCSADLNPATASGAARQLQASCLLGAVEVVMEELVGIATGPHGSETAVQTGERLSHAFELHSRLYDLAREGKSQGGSKTKQTATETAAGSGGDGSGGGAAGNGTAPPPLNGGRGGNGGGGNGGAKRPRDLCPDLVPVEQRPPAMSPDCLARLCSGVVRDGLVVDLKVGTAGVNTAAAEGISAHTRLARSPGFQAFTLRSCLNCLRAASSATGEVLSDMLVECAAGRLGRAAAREAAVAGQGRSSDAGGLVNGCLVNDAPAASWTPMARPLILLCQSVLTTWSGAVKRPAATRRGGGGGAAGGPAAAAAAAAARREAAAMDSLATLAVSGMRDLLAVAAGLGGLEAVAWVLRGLPIHAQDTQAQVDERDLPPEDIVSARLPHFSDMLARLMITCSFKEATSLVEVVVTVARLLPPQAQRAASEACWELMQQTEPQVTHTGLVRALVAAYVTLRGKAELEALLAVANYVQEVVGKAGGETQIEFSGPGVLHEGTAQLAALEVLRQLEGHMEQGEEPLEALVRGTGGSTVLAMGTDDGASGGAASGSRSAGGGGGSGGGAGAGAKAARSVAQLVDALCHRLQEALHILHVVVQTRLGNPQVLEVQVEVLIKAYRLLAALAKAHLPAKGVATGTAPPPPPLGRAFQDLVALVHKNLTPPVYAAVGDDLGAPACPAVGEEGSTAARLSRAKLKRDAKAYSQLVHAIEDWEKHLLALEKAFKAQGLNLMRGAKRSANRDFQIVAPAAAGPAAAGRMAEERAVGLHN